jgi:hypothetical protein
MKSFLLFCLHKILHDIFMPSIGGIAGIELLKKLTKDILKLCEAGKIKKF